jgi:hypothetical protein
MDLLEKLGEKEKATSRKGAFYYCFNQKKYEELIERGFNFDL